MFYQIATGYAGVWYGIDPFDQPGVELGKQLTYAAMGRPGYEAAARRAGRGCERSGTSMATSRTRVRAPLAVCLTLPPSRPTFTGRANPATCEGVQTWLTRPSGRSICTRARWRWCRGGVTVRDPAKLRSHGHRPAGLAGSVRHRRGARGGPVAAVGAGPGDRRPPGLDPGALRGPRPGRRERLHRARHQRAHDGLRHRARRLPGRPSGQGRRDPARDRAFRDRLHRPAAGRVRLGADRRRAPRRLRPAALHPGRPLPGQPEEVPGRSRGRGRRGEEADRRGDRRRLLQHRRRHLDAGRSLASHAGGAAAAQLRARGRDHRVHPGARARWRHRLRRRGDRRGRHEEQHRRGAARLHAAATRPAWPPTRARSRGSARSRSRRGRRTAGWSCPTARWPT